MRSLLAASLLFGVAACSKGDDKKAEAKKPSGPALKIGDPAPVVKASKWLNGPTVAVEPGKVYVFDFWATWCGPCIQAMPHLADLQREYKGEGLVVVPVTTTDERNTLKSIETFVSKRGPKLGVPFAVCESRETDDAFMKAAEQGGIPCSFVVDRQGKLAFIGHPMELDDVLPQVLAGKWRGEADVEAIRKMTQEFEKALATAEEKPEQTLTDLAGFEAKYPTKSAQPMFRLTKAYLLMRAKRFDDARALTESLIKAQSEKKVSGVIDKARALWSDGEVNPEKKHIGLAVTAGEAVLAIEGDKDPVALLGLADACFLVGDKKRAVATAEKAVAAADDADLKRFLGEQLKKYKGDDK